MNFLITALSGRDNWRQIGNRFDLASKDQKDSFSKRVRDNILNLCFVLENVSLERNLEANGEILELVERGIQYDVKGEIRVENNKVIIPVSVQYVDMEPLNDIGLETVLHLLFMDKIDANIKFNDYKLERKGSLGLNLYELKVNLNVFNK